MKQRRGSTAACGKQATVGARGEPRGSGASGSHSRSPWQDPPELILSGALERLLAMEDGDRWVSGSFCMCPSLAPRGAARGRLAPNSGPTFLLMDCLPIAPMHAGAGGQPGLLLLALHSSRGAPGRHSHLQAAAGRVSGGACSHHRRLRCVCMLHCPPAFIPCAAALRLRSCQRCKGSLQ